MTTGDPSPRTARDPGADIDDLDDPDPPAVGSDARAAELSAAVDRLSAGEPDPAHRRRLLGRLVTDAGRQVRRLVRPRAAARWVADTLVSVVPHLTIRDLDTLRSHHGGRDGEDLADALVRNATRVTAGVGAAGGGASAIGWVAPPTLLSAPVLLAVETLVVVSIEVKLLAELHEAYGMPVTGSPTERGTQLLTAWAKRRGVTIATPAKGMAAVLGTSMRKELTERVARRFGRNLTTLAPFLTGAVIGAELNRRATKSLAEDVRHDLRSRSRTAMEH